MKDIKNNHSYIVAPGGIGNGHCVGPGYVAYVVADWAAHAGGSGLSPGTVVGLPIVTVS